MARKVKPEPDDKEQSQRFVDTAKALGVDQSGKTFDRALSVIIAPALKSVKRKKSRPVK